MIFYKGKHLRSSDRKYMQNAIPLFLGMLICMSCLVGGTWAWFTANQTAPVQLIQSAEYSVAVEVKEASTDTPIEVNVEENVASCTLTTNTSYSVTLTPGGTATKGYCLITDGDKVYTTGQLLVDTTFVFTYNNGLVGDFTTTQDFDELIDNTSDRNFAIAWYWGEYPNTLSQMTFSMEEPILLENGSVIGQPIAERHEEKTEPTASINEQTTPTAPDATLTESSAPTAEPSVSAESTTSSAEQKTSTALNSTPTEDDTSPTGSTGPRCARNGRLGSTSQPRLPTFHSKFPLHCLGLILSAAP